MTEQTITVPDFGTHTLECHQNGWYMLDWDNECLAPARSVAPASDAELFELEVRQDRTQDAAE